jgi:twitching motility protein PilT
LPRSGTPGRVLALEVLIPNPAVRNLIREDKIHQIYTQMQVGQAKHGMQTLNQSLYSLYARHLISLEEAYGRSNDPDELRNMIEGRTAGGSADPALQQRR